MIEELDFLLQDFDQDFKVYITLNNPTNTERLITNTLIDNLKETLIRLENQLLDKEKVLLTNPLNLYLANFILDIGATPGDLAQWARAKGLT